MPSKARSTTSSMPSCAARIPVRSRPSPSHCRAEEFPMMNKFMMQLGVVAFGLAATVAQARAPGESTAWRVPDCDHACLTQFAKDYVAAIAKRNAATLKQAKNVRFTENNVPLVFGKEGLWATATGVAPTALIAADTHTGNVAWLGTAEEN